MEPTLPELLRAGWARAGRRGRILGMLAAAILAAAAAALTIASLSAGGSFTYRGPETSPFSLSWDELDRVEPQGDELVRLESRAGGELVQRFAVSPLGLPWVPADPEAEPLPGLALAAEAVAERIEAAHPGARVVLEGRTLLAVDRGPEAYQLGFVAPASETAGGGTLVGKRLLVPDPDRPGEGVRIELLERTERPAVIEKLERAPAGFFARWPIQILLEDAVAVRTEEGLEEPLRSFELG